MSLEKIPLIQRCLAFASTSPYHVVKYANVTSSWEETVLHYGGAKLLIRNALNNVAFRAWHDKKLYYLLFKALARLRSRMLVVVLDAIFGEGSKKNLQFPSYMHKFAGDTQSDPDRFTIYHCSLNSLKTVLFDFTYGHAKSNILFTLLGNQTLQRHPEEFDEILNLLLKKYLVEISLGDDEKAIETLLRSSTFCPTTAAADPDGNLYEGHLNPRIPLLQPVSELSPLSKLLFYIICSHNSYANRNSKQIFLFAMCVIQNNTTLFRLLLDEVYSKIDWKILVLQGGIMFLPLGLMPMSKDFVREDTRVLVLHPIYQAVRFVIEDQNKDEKKIVFLQMMSSCLTSPVFGRILYGCTPIRLKDTFLLLKMRFNNQVSGAHEHSLPRRLPPLHLACEYGKVEIAKFLIQEQMKRGEIAENNNNNNNNNNNSNDNNSDDKSIPVHHRSSCDRTRRITPTLATLNSFRTTQEQKIKLLQMLFSFNNNNNNNNNNSDSNITLSDNFLDPRYFNCLTDVSFRFGEWADTPLHVSIRRNDSSVAKFLLTEGLARVEKSQDRAKIINALNTVRMSPIELAVARNNFEIVQIFLERFPGEVNINEIKPAQRYHRLSLFSPQLIWHVAYGNLTRAIHETKFNHFRPKEQQDQFVEVEKAKKIISLLEKHNDEDNFAEFLRPFKTADGGTSHFSRHIVGATTTDTNLAAACLTGNLELVRRIVSEYPNGFEQIFYSPPTDITSTSAAAHESGRPTTIAAFGHLPFTRNILRLITLGFEPVNPQVNWKTIDDHRQRKVFHCILPPLRMLMSCFTLNFEVVPMMLEIIVNAVLERDEEFPEKKYREGLRVLANEYVASRTEPVLISVMKERIAGWPKIPAERFWCFARACEWLLKAGADPEMIVPEVTVRGVYDPCSKKLISAKSLAKREIQKKDHLVCQICQSLLSKF